MVNVPELLPELPELYVSVTVQLAPGATSPQLLVWLNLPLEIEAWRNVTFVPVLLVKVTDCLGVPAKLSDVLDCATPEPATGVVGAAIAAAARATVLLPALLVSVKVPVSEPE